MESSPIMYWVRVNGASMAWQKSTAMACLQAGEEAADTHHSRCLQACALHHLPCGALHGGAASCGTEGFPKHAAFYLRGQAEGVPNHCYTCPLWRACQPEILGYHPRLSCGNAKDPRSVVAVHQYVHR